MIYLYSGTPGSGKSLHMARTIYYALYRKKPVICNFEINRKFVKNSSLFQYVENSDLSPEFLKKYSMEYFKGKSVKESEITLFIDEAQMMFNARSWNAKDREKWNKFFEIHRHYGYDIMLVSHSDRRLDRQIRELIEYEYIHRKVSNYGWRGVLLSVMMFCPCLFVYVKLWYPMKEQVGREFCRSSKRLYRLYNTYMTFEDADE